MSKLFKYLKNVWWEVLLVVIIVAIDAYLTLLLPDFMSRIATIMEDPNGYAVTLSEGLIPILDHYFVAPSGNNVQDIWTIGLVMIIISVMDLILASIGNYLNSLVGAYFGKRLRHEVFNKVINLSISDFTKYGTATLITRTTNDIEQCQNLVQQGLRILVRSPVTLAVAIVMILTKNALLALVLAISIPFIVGVVAVLFSIVSPLFARFQIVFDKVTGVLRESITGVRVIRAFNQQDKEQKRFEGVSDEAASLVTKFTRVLSFGNPVISVSFDLTYMGIYCVGFYLLDGKSHSYYLANFGNIIASAEYAMWIMNSFVMFSMLLIMIPRANASAKRVNEILNIENNVVDPANPIVPETHEGIIEFKDVSFTFPEANLPTISHISFKSKPGSTTAIIGSTGSGKSSLINLIPRFYDASSGEVLVDGVNVKDMKKEELRSRIGFVPQKALLFSGTIKSNMTFGNPSASDEDISKALEVAQATHFVSKKEKGVDSLVEQGGKNYSGGQRQRLCIARALVKKPEIYVFDDSFSALDFKTDIKLRTALKSYTDKASVLIVAQRVSTILDADDIIVLSDGKKVGEGTHEELLKKCKVYQEIVYSQLDKEEITKTLELAQGFAKEGGSSL